MSWLYVPDLVSLLLIGLAFGFFGGFFGVGGGIIAVPVFVNFFGMPQQLAQGTALVLMVPNLCLALYNYFKRHPLPAKYGAQIALGGVLATWSIAHWAVGLPSQVLALIFNGFLLIAGGWMIVNTLLSLSAKPRSLAKPYVLPLVGVAGGGSMGLLGLGGGLVATPVLVNVLGQPQVRAQALSLAMVTPCAAVALATFANHHQVNWSMGLPMAIGGIASVGLGVATAHLLPEAWLKRLFGLLMVAVGVVSIVQLVLA